MMDKTKKTNLKNRVGEQLCPSFSALKLHRAGFTLVEMMVAVALIGVLASVTVPNFKKYQAKSKAVEAKMQLALIYTSQTGFYQIYDMYATCLDHMGYDPKADKPKRFYAIGFPNIVANIDTGFYNSAVGERLPSSACPRTLGEISNKSIFLAGKSIGSSAMDSLAQFKAATPNFSNALDDSLGPFSNEEHSGLGTQTVEDTKVFTVAAAGYIDASAVTPIESSLWTVNHLKEIVNHRPGY
jgi:type IV pilus assembly protein PilA